jgi:hypothetical protein
MVTHNIPLYFIVKNTGDKYWKEFIQWFNKRYKMDWSGNSDMVYYGFDGGSSYKGTNCFRDKNDFNNDPVVFESAEEFMNLLNNTSKIYELW